MSHHAPPRSTPVPASPDSFPEVHRAAQEWCFVASDPRAAPAALLAAQIAYRRAKRESGIAEDWTPPRKRYRFRGGRGLPAPKIPSAKGASR